MILPDKKLDWPIAYEVVVNRPYHAGHRYAIC